MISEINKPTYLIKQKQDNLEFVDFQKTVQKLSEDTQSITVDEVNNKIKYLNDNFKKYEDSRNQIIVLGTIDYMRIALREANLNINDEYKLLIFINSYLRVVERILNNTKPEDLIDLDLDYLEDIFDQFQEFVCDELQIIKRIDDDFDESLFY